jgi:hypothetical protein
MTKFIGADDPSQAIRSAVMADARVQSVELIGSRATGTATELSDWDYLIHSSDPGAVAGQLPALAARLRPLAQQWDPLSGTPVYMIILPGAVKADLFPAGLVPADLVPATLPSRAAAAGRALQPDLGDIDAHFWDWNLWLGAKRLRGQDDLVSSELGKMWRHLLHPLGAACQPASAAWPPATQQDAVILYLELRRGREQQLGRTVARNLGHAVMARLQATGLLQSPLPRVSFPPGKK